MDSIKLVFNHLSTQASLIQLVICLVAIGATIFIKTFTLPKYKTIYLLLDKRPKLRGFIIPTLSYCIFLAFALIGATLSLTTLNDASIIFGVIELSLFYILMRYVNRIFRSKLLSIVTGLLFISIWVLNKLDVLNTIIDYLDQYSFSIGTLSITPLSFFKSILTILFFIWGSLLLSAFSKDRLKKVRSLKANTKEIITKVIDITIYSMAFLTGLNLLGINLTTLTVLGGALGVGIGFGLQKITSNLISGFILLFEQSIKIGDLIEMDDDLYGFVVKLGTRYILIETFDGKEILVPNEDFITNRVINWTHTNKTGRIEIVVGVSYNSDLKAAQVLIEEAAIEYSETLESPAPKCYLSNFGDSAVEFTLHFFISNITIGRFQPKSEVMMSIWEKLKENNINIPYPQRDVHIIEKKK
jgi:small-conductance mechanosensitive channel